MSQAIEKYLDRVMACANFADERHAAAVRDEQRDHLMEYFERLKAQGVPPEDAVFQAIEAHGSPAAVGYSLRPRWPLIDVRARGTARGIIAVGPRAVGVFAFGGVAIGLFAFGGVALGGVTMGGLTAALLFSWGGVAVVPVGVAFAGLAVAMVAIGGLAVGVMAAGGMAIGLWAVGDQVITHYTKETAPQWMTSLFSLLPNESGAGIITLILLALFFPMLIISNWMIYKETRRLKDADPLLAE